jgi:hypothetical protein
VCWSGGIDSTCILVGLMKFVDPKNITVLLTEDSIKENPYFYKQFIENKISTQSLDLFAVTEENYNQLNFQTATNMPLSPTNYKNYVGSIYIYDDKKNNVNPLQKGMYCMSKPKLLYDGVWESKINNESLFDRNAGRNGKNRDGGSATFGL